MLTRLQWVKRLLDARRGLRTLAQVWSGLNGAGLARSRGFGLPYFRPCAVDHRKRLDSFARFTGRTESQDENSTIDSQEDRLLRTKQFVLPGALWVSLTARATADIVHTKDAAKVRDPDAWLLKAP